MAKPETQVKSNCGEKKSQLNKLETINKRIDIATSQ
jgi:hypothetical protein